MRVSLPKSGAVRRTLLWLALAIATAIAVACSSDSNEPPQRLDDANLNPQPVLPRDVHGQPSQGGTSSTAQQQSNLKRESSAGAPNDDDQ